MIKYPDARREENAVDNYHGTLILDSYRWLEDTKSVDVKDFAKAQNNLTDNYLKSCQIRQNIKTGLTKLCDFSQVECPFRRNQSYFYFQDNVLYKAQSLDEGNEGQVVLDPSSETILSGISNVTLASSIFEKTGEVFGNSLCSISNDGEILAFGISESGSVWNTIYFKNIKTGEYYKEKLEYVQDTYLSWTHDNKGVFYGRYPNQSLYTNESIYYHILNTDQSSDKMILGFPNNPKWELKAKVSDCGKYLITYVLKDCGGNTMVYLGNIEDLISSFNKTSSTKMTPQLRPIISKFDGDYDYITNSDTKLYFLTNKDAPNSKIICIDLLIPEKEIIIVKEHTKDVLEWATCVNRKYLLTCYMRDVKSNLQLRNLENGSLIHVFPLSIGSIVGHSGRREDAGFFIKFSSFLSPGIIYRFNFDEKMAKKDCICNCGRLGNSFRLKVYKECKLEALDPSLYKTKQIFYKSKDNTAVPMFLVYKKTMVRNGNNLCVLHGYGGFNLALAPTFDPVYIAIAKHCSGIVAIANIRGGGEYGKNWYEDGIRLKKQNCFDDFLAAADYLIKKGYTSSKCLVIRGNSNGGLLVGACVNQRPELFSCAIAGYGVMDLLRFHKFTTGSCWISDYGSSDNEEDFKNLLKFSPFHNVKMPSEGNVQYPAMLLITADHDEKVLPLHSYKLIAELQRKIGGHPKQKSPLLIRIETNVGHGDGMSLDESLNEVTDILSFVMLTVDGTKFED